MSTLTLNKFASTSLVDNTVSTVSRKISALSSVFSHCKSSVTDNSVGVVETTDVLVSNEELRRFDQAISAKFHQVLDKSQTPITRVVFKEAATQRNAKVVRHEVAPFLFVDDESELECEDEIFNLPATSSRVVKAKVVRKALAPFRFVDDF